MTLLCSVVECDRGAGYLGLCSTHRRYQREGRDLRPFGRPSPNSYAGRTCEFPGCDRPMNSKRLCVAHHKQLRKGRQLSPIGDKEAIAAIRRAYWDGLTPEERVERMKPAMANLSKRGEDWVKANSEAQAAAWREGRIRFDDRRCAMCEALFRPGSGVQIYCGAACRSANRRAVRYGLTRPEMVAIERSHAGACAICRRETKLVVDHDHKTGKVRGLLCSTCNTGLGKLGDNADRLRQAIQYLEM
jgi:Recombination endonuclease VII